MKKLFAPFVLFVIGLVCLLPADQARAATDVNAFTISNYQIDYDLGRDADGRSTLKTVESIDVQFPDIDQNRGIERAIPLTYDNHPTSLSVTSVTDAAGRNLNYSVYSNNNNQVLRIGDADKYVRGLQQYVITYQQRDVTRYFNDTNSDEFYWDTNGTGWKVPIDTLTVNLRLESSLREQLSGNQRCYLGVAGSNQTCDLTPTNDGFSLQANGLAPGENASLAIGFKPGTFTTYQQPPTNWFFVAWGIAFAITTLISIILIIWFIVRYYRKSDRTAEFNTIVPEYLPPKDTSVSAAAVVYGKTGAVFSAQLIDFAVRKYLTIYQTREKSFFRSAQYELEIIKDISSLKAEEQELLTDIFEHTTVGSHLDLASLKSNNYTIARKLSDNPAKLNEDIKGAYGLRAIDEEQRAWFKRAGIYSLIAGLVTLSPGLLIAAITAFVCGYTLWPLTDKGLALKRYLEGLKLYIKTAEEDRIKMLQGPDTAEKIGSSEPIDVHDNRQMIRLYEKTLPYAIMFGQEKAWSNQLGQYYQSLGQSPDWLSAGSSAAAFNAAAFNSALSSFSSAASYSNPSNASTGGSSGGGSSGGGGGGGGGGGW